MTPSARDLRLMISRSMGLRVRQARRRSDASGITAVDAESLREALRRDALDDRDRLNKRLGTVMAGEGPTGLPDITFSPVWTIRARADPLGHVVVSAGLLLSLENAFLRAATKENFLDLFDDELEGWQGGRRIRIVRATPPLLPGHLADLPPTTRLADAPRQEAIPLEPWRLCQVELLRELAVHWILLHETAHLVDGHLGLLVELANEEGNPDPHLDLADDGSDAGDPLWRDRPLRSLARRTRAFGCEPRLCDLRRAIEFQADHFAFALLARLHGEGSRSTGAFDRYRRRLRRFARSEADALGQLDEGRRLRIMATAAGTVMLLVERLAGQLGGRVAGYPSPMARLLNIQLAVLSISKFARSSADGISLPAASAGDPEFAPFLKNALMRPAFDLEVVAEDLRVSRALTPSQAAADPVDMLSTMRDVLAWFQPQRLGSGVEEVDARTKEARELFGFLDKIHALKDLCMAHRSYSVKP